MEDCVFCKIAAAEIPSVKVYEDDKFLAFMDINPLGKGHCLLIPKDHHQDIFDMPETLLRDLIAVSKRVAQGIKNGLNAEGMYIWQANGRAAAQLIPHYHMHFLPRWKDDNLTIGTWEPVPGDMEEIQAAAKEIKKGF